MKIQPILGSYELKGKGIFGHALPKIIKTIFSFPDFVPACKKSVYSICSFLRYIQFESPVTKLAIPIFDHAHPKKTLIK